jgi:hypothetical protein
VGARGPLKLGLAHPNPARLQNPSNEAARRIRVKELAHYLLDHAIIDFEGAITIEQVRQFLRDDDSREARLLLSKLIEDKGVDDLLIVVADCLREHLRTGINDDIVREQLSTYSES